MKNAKRTKRIAIACIGAGCLLIVGAIYAVNQLLAAGISGGILIVTGLLVDVD